jgi:hypothetical protein
MAHEEIAHMLELTLDGIRSSLFDEQAAALVVTIGTPGCRMASAANGRLASRGDPMPFQPGCVVTQECLRHEATQLFANMARCAIPAFEVRLVTFEADGHGRRTDGTCPRVDHAAMAKYALPVDFLLHQVAIMREQNSVHSLGGFACKSQRSIHQVNAVGVTCAAIANPRGSLPIRLAHATVTAGTRQTFVLTGATAFCR